MGLWSLIVEDAFSAPCCPKPRLLLVLPGKRLQFHVKGPGYLVCSGLEADAPGCILGYTCSHGSGG